MPGMKSFYSRTLAVVLLALPSAAVAQRGDTVYMEDRLNQLQQTITMLTGQVEQLQYRNQQLQQQMEKMQADHEFRLEQIEKGRGGAARPPGPTPSPGPAPPPNTAAHPPPGPGGTGGAQGEQVYHDAFKLLQDGDYPGAERAFKNFVQRNPQHVLAGNAQYWLGVAYYVPIDYQNGKVALGEG